ncbi:MAG: S-layer homology domain-containing protein [Actinobacteria bacterium]|nr:S-layer homology domain-containing protein [Actinomycetota bacterium]
MAANRRKLVAVLILLTALSLALFGVVSSSQPADNYRAAQENFPDVSPGDWFYTYVVRLVTVNVVNGYPDGTFRPQGNITRAEFAKMTILAIGERPSTASSSFRDVANIYWAKGYIERAKELNIISGYPDGTFRPAANISRQEIAKIVMLAGKSSPATSFRADFRDMPSSLWSWPYILKAKDLGIISGYPDGMFRPFNFATRAEASKMVAELLDAIAPPTLTLEIISVTSPVGQGEPANLIARTAPGAECNVTVIYASGPSDAEGLEPKTADPDGLVSWTWIVGTRTTPGKWPIIVTATLGGETITEETSFIVTE